MKERMMMVFVFSYYMFFGFQIGFCADINNAVLFPVDGLLGDSYFPRDSGESDAPSPRNRFTVVWCGMYGDKSQYYNIRYKGTGAHSGMDIVGEVSENIYAIAKGKVIISECNTGGWGGLVVIEHAPSTFSISSLNNYYSVYAHLRKRNVIVGQLVHLGKFIGLMGGASSDECYGNSSGRHLHFQIDVGENFNYPKFIGYTANEYSDPHYNTIKTELGKESYDSILTDETVDPISFIEASYQYHPGKFSNGWRFCTSSNSTDFVPYSEPFAQFMANSAGILGMGFPITHVEQYPGTLDTQCSFHDNVNYKVWAQGFQNVSSQYNDPTGYLVLNPNIDNIPLGYKGVVFPVHGRLREYWELNYCNLGPPASNEFYREGTEIIVQWFEPTPNNYIAVGYWTATGIFQRSDEIKHTCFELRFKISDPNINMGCSPEGCDGQGGGEPLPDNVLSGDNWSIASYGLYGHVNHDTSEP
ncbi:M23 family metallopeptidase, partial [Candidatus Parcubacteria bacterium]|nr:M23 family metallopeptidase [Candidatus Parcubacteria bacterium]